jgi:hypothetical protein
MTENEIGHAIIGAAMKVHSVNGLAIRAVYYVIPATSGYPEPHDLGGRPLFLARGKPGPPLTRG